MPDTTAPAPVTTPDQGEAKSGRSRGYFNKAQLEDIDLAEAVLAAAQRQPAEMAKHRIDTAQAANLQATGEERALVIMLQGIQSAAKQWHKMLATDGDPTTNFYLDGYLIGERLNASSPLLKQNAEALLAKATADHLPGYDAAELDFIAAATAKYQVAESLSDEADSGQSADRISRDALLKLINTRRSAIQHAADGTWPYTAEASQPFRKAFHLPLSRPLGL